MVTESMASLGAKLSTKIEFNSESKRVKVSRFLTAFKPRQWKKTGRCCGNIKFEYVRVRLYRCLKRSMRCFFNRNTFALGGVAMYSSAHSYEIVEKMKQHCRNNAEILEAFSRKEYAPNIDHSNEPLELNFKTYNSRYVKYVLSVPAICKIYKQYLKLIFEETDLDKQCEHWLMNCCDGTHSAECVGKWDEFKCILAQEVFIYKDSDFIPRPLPGTEKI